MTTVTCTVQIQIQAPLPKVFEYVADLTKHPEWSEGELKIEPSSPGLVAVGKEYNSRGQVAIQKDRPNQLRVSEYEPPHRFSFVAHDPSFGDVHHVFAFSEQGDGVMVTRTMTLNLNPAIAVAFRLVVYPLIGNPAMQKFFALLKAGLEK